MGVTQLTVQGRETGVSELEWKLLQHGGWHFHVDIVGGCNLRCPTCPMGNSRDVSNATGHMSPELLDQIVRKAKAECKRLDVNLYNWTEPFIHPNLPAMIGVVHAHGVACGLSTNLNLLKNLEGIMEANPREIKISLSGFWQESYGVTHSRGDIEVVKKNMAELAGAWKRARCSTRVVVAFHRYLGNHEEEALMRAYSQSLGFQFEPAWAYMMPLEKVLAYAVPESTDVQLTSEDRAMIARFALPMDRAIDVCKESPVESCKLREKQMALTCRGEVMLCCGAFDQNKYALGNYLDAPLEELQRRKYRHRQCKSCMENGLPTLFLYASEEFDRIALEHVARQYPDAILEGMDEQKRKQRGVRALPRKIRKEYRKLVAKLARL